MPAEGCHTTPSQQPCYHAKQLPLTWSSAMGGTTFPNTSTMLPLATGGCSGGTEGGWEPTPLAKRCCTSARSSCGRGTRKQAMSMQCRQALHAKPSNAMHCTALHCHNHCCRITRTAPAPPRRLTTPVCTALCTSSARSPITSAAGGCPAEAVHEQQRSAVAQQAGDAMEARETGKRNNPMLPL